MLRTLITFVLLVLIVLLGAVFAVQNPGSMALDLGVARFEEIRISVAFAVTFGAGWLFGLACCGVAMLRVLQQRRRLRRSLRAAEREISSLRSRPLRDAH